MTNAERQKKYRQDNSILKEWREVVRLFKAGFLTKEELKAFILSIRRLKGISSQRDILSKIMQGNQYARRKGVTITSKPLRKKGNI